MSQEVHAVMGGRGVELDLQPSKLAYARISG